MLVGCTQKVIITLDKLPDGITGKPYYVQINIDGGSGPISHGSFDLQIKPNDSGLQVTFPEIDGISEYNNIALTGAPNIIGSITIFIKGDMLPSGWNTPPSDFEKKLCY